MMFLLEHYFKDSMVWFHSPVVKCLLYIFFGKTSLNNIIEVVSRTSSYIIIQLLGKCKQPLIGLEVNI